MKMQEYWSENPPVHLLVKAFMGIKSKPSIKNTEAQKENEQNIDNMMLGIPQDLDNSNRIKVRMI